MYLLVCGKDTKKEMLIHKKETKAPLTNNKSANMPIIKG